MRTAAYKSYVQIGAQILVARLSAILKQVHYHAAPCSTFLLVRVYHKYNIALAYKPGIALSIDDPSFAITIVFATTRITYDFYI